MSNIDGWFADLFAEPFQINCKHCGEVTTDNPGNGADMINYSVERPCAYGNCTREFCPNCDTDQGGYSASMAGWPDCPCGDPTYFYPGRILWPFTSKFLTLHAVRFLMWTRGKKFWPQQVFPYVKAMELFARSHNPEYFEMSDSASQTNR